jgi:hemolysin activation/secretion protein
MDYKFVKFNQVVKAVASALLLSVFVQNSLAEVALEPKGMQVEIRENKTLKPAVSGGQNVSGSTASASPKLAKRIKIRAFNVVGNTQIETRDLLAAAGDTTGAEPVSIGYEELQSMAEKMTALYRQRGYAVAVVQLRAQEIVDGTVVFTATEGRLSDFVAVSKLEDVPLKLRAEAAIASAIPDQRRDALRQADVERAILLAGELTNSQAEAVLVPGEKLGTTKLQAQLTPKQAFTGSVQLDNSGNDTTGKQQLGATLAKRNLVALGDSLDASVLTSEATTRLNSYGLNYSIPVGSDGWKVGARFSRVNYSLGGSFDSLNYRGMSTQSGFNVSYPLVRRFESQADFKLAYSQVDLVDKRGESLLAASTRYADVSTAEFRGSFNDKAFKSGAFNDWSASLKSGWLQFGTRSQKLTDAATNQISGEFQALNIGYLRDQQLSPGWSGVFNLRGQLASKNLDSSQKMALGGPEAVRAFASGEASGDQGFIVSIELARTSVFPILGRSTTSRLAVFYDFGSVDTNKIPLAANASTNRVERSGQGIQWQLSQRGWLAGDQINFRLFWAETAGEAKLSSVDNRSSRFGAALGYKF